MAPAVSDAGLGTNEIRQACGKQDDFPGSRAIDVTMQLAQLVTDGLVEVSKGPRGSKMHKAIRPAESVESLEQVSDQLEV